MAVTAVAALLVSNVSAMTTETLAEAEIRAATAAAGAAAVADSNDGASGADNNDNAVEGGWEMVSPDASAYWKIDIDAAMDSSSCSSPRADDTSIVAETPLEEASDQVPEDAFIANAGDVPDTPAHAEISSDSSSRSITGSSAEDATPTSGSCEADGEWQVVAAQYMEVLGGVAVRGRQNSSEPSSAAAAASAAASDDAAVTLAQCRDGDDSSDSGSRKRARAASKCGTMGMTDSFHGSHFAARQNARRRANMNRFSFSV
jgi:hypothetical protein